MCRRLLAALYQVKVDADTEFDRQGRKRQGLPEFVPDQFVVLYGIKSLAIKNINEFLYGVRAERFRKTANDETEPEPLLMPFWRAAHHGVPLEDRMHADEFDLYLDVLGATAKTVGEEHTLNTKGGAFWNMLGSMAEIQLPVFVLLNVLARLFDKSGSQPHPELSERLKRLTVQRAAAFAKALKDPRRAPKPCPSYKPTILGKPEMDSRGVLPLEAFLAICMEGAEAQREKDAVGLEAIFKTWDPDGEGGFDAFADCLLLAAPDMPEEEMISIYQLATSGDDPDNPDFGLIEARLRKKKVTLKRKGGEPSSPSPGAKEAGGLDTVAEASPTSLGDPGQPVGASAADTGAGGDSGACGAACAAAFAAAAGKGGGGSLALSRWKQAQKTTNQTNSLIRMLLTASGGVPGEDEDANPDGVAMTASD